MGMRLYATVAGRGLAAGVQIAEVGVVRGLQRVEPVIGCRRHSGVILGRLAPGRGVRRGLGCLVAAVLIGFGLASCGQAPVPNSGVFTEPFTGVVMAAPAHCVRVTRPVSLAVLGWLCLQDSPGGPAGACVQGPVSNGGRVVAGITRLPGTGRRVAAARCRVFPALAASVRAGEIIGVVWASPRCLAVPLPYPGSHDGLICSARHLGVPGECVQAVYRVAGAGSGDPFDGGVIRIAPANCTGLHRW
jgi:hypothetical protein